MKRLIPIVLVLVLTVSLFAGCRSRREDETGTTDTTATQGSMMPDTGDILPDANDKVDPNSGANQNTTTPSVGADTVPNTTTDTTGTTEGTNRTRRYPAR